VACFRFPTQKQLLTPPSDLTQSSSVVLVSVYDRNQAGEGFLGMLQIKPVLKDGYTVDQWYKLGTRGTEQVAGEVWIQMTFTAARVSVLLCCCCASLRRGGG
jgi:protein-serine/threonine kinase